LVPLIVTVLPLAVGQASLVSRVVHAEDTVTLGPVLVEVVPPVPVDPPADVVPPLAVVPPALDPPDRAEPPLEPPAGVFPPVAVPPAGNAVDPPVAAVDPPRVAVTPPEAVVDPPRAVVVPPVLAVDPPEAEVVPPAEAVEPPEAVVAPPVLAVDPPEAEVVPPAVAVDPPEAVLVPPVLALLPPEAEVFPPVAAVEPPFGDELVPPEATVPPCVLVPPELTLPPVLPAAPEDPGLLLHPVANTAKGRRRARRRADFCISFSPGGWNRSREHLQAAMPYRCLVPASRDCFDQKWVLPDGRSRPARQRSCNAPAGGWNGPPTSRASAMPGSVNHDMPRAVQGQGLFKDLRLSACARPGSQTEALAGYNSVALLWELLHALLRID
jgi:hypothetical protein